MKQKAKEQMEPEEPEVKIPTVSDIMALTGKSDWQARKVQSEIKFGLRDWPPPPL